MNRQQIKIASLLTTLMALTACGSGGDKTYVNVSSKSLLEPGSAQCAFGGVETLSGPDRNENGKLDQDEVANTALRCDTEQDLAGAEHPWAAVDVLKPHINVSAPTSYKLHLAESAESLVVYLSSGVDGKALGDPDLYVKYEGAPTAEQGVGDGLNDCVSYNGSDYNEVCIIDKPRAGVYHILVQASGEVVDASLYATTKLFKQSHQCNDEIKLRGQALTYEDAAQTCDELASTKQRFLSVLNPELHADSGIPVVGDLNQNTNLHVFASLSNHMAWAEHLWETDNSSGIYFETSPTEWWHSSDILTFNGIEWTGGLPVIRSLSHEYIHALDGRYNKADGYRWDMGWWSEGLAEYLSTHFQLPYQRVVHGHSGDSYTLAQIFKRENGVNVYSWGELAVAFLLEERKTQVAEMLSLMRAGKWDEFHALMATIAEQSEADFVTFYQQTVPQQFRGSAKSIELGEYKLIEGRGGWLYKVDVPAGTDSVTFASQGGSGNVDMWVNTTPYHPYLDQQPLCQSTSELGNQEACTLNNPAAGSYFVTLGSDFSGADIVDLYLSVCSGADCSVALPDAKAVVQVEQPYLPHWPEKGTFGKCTLEETYGRDTLSYASPFKVTNNSDKAVNLHWINNYSGGAGGAFDTLEPGNEYNSENWRVGDRMMLTDAAANCLAVAIVNDSDNNFSIDQALVADAATEKPPATVGTLGSCDELLVPYSRTSSAAAVNVINSSSKVINLHWVATSDGRANLDNDYGPLANGENYQADYWVIGDRMAVYAEGSCVGVIDLTDADMQFEITDANFE